MPLGTVVLGLLADGPAHGYDLKRLHDQRFGGPRPLAFGQVYATLGRLQRDGLVETVEQTKDGGPERTVYAITEQGAEALREWLGETEPPASYAADELVRKTITSLHRHAGPGGPSDTEDFLTRQRASHLEAMRLLTRTRSEASELGVRIALEHSLSHLDADLRWLEETRERVRRHPADPAPDPRPAPRLPSETERNPQ